MNREISKTRIEARASVKTNRKLAEAINKIKKKNPGYAKQLAMPLKSWAELNLDQIDRKTKTGESVFVPGKVLSFGELTKKIRIVAWKFSKKTVEKLKKSKLDYTELTEEIKKNPGLEGLKLIR
jgi:large subunit ribosomal protein L18e